MAAERGHDIGAGTMGRLDDDLKAVDVALSDEELERIDEVSATQLPYPRWTIRMQAGREKR